MTFLERARYAAYLTVVISAALGLFLMLASADAIALLPASASDLVLSPLLYLAVYAVAFLMTPWFATRFRISRR